MIMQTVHWISATIFVAIFGYAGIYKILKVPAMVEGMQSMGFGLRWTLFIGWVETLAVAGFLTGMFFQPTLKNISVLVLWPFAIGALTTHFAFHHGFSDYKNALIVTVLPILLLATDRRFELTL